MVDLSPSARSTDATTGEILLTSALSTIKLTLMNLVGNLNTPSCTPRRQLYISVGIQDGRVAAPIVFMHSALVTRDNVNTTLDIIYRKFLAVENEIALRSNDKGKSDPIATSLDTFVQNGIFVLSRMPDYSCPLLFVLTDCVFPEVQNSEYDNLYMQLNRHDVSCFMFNYSSSTFSAHCGFGYVPTVESAQYVARYCGGEYFDADDMRFLTGPRHDAQMDLKVVNAVDVRPFHVALQHSLLVRISALSRRPMPELNAIRRHLKLLQIDPLHQDPDSLAALVLKKRKPKRRAFFAVDYAFPWVGDAPELCLWREKMKEYILGVDMYHLLQCRVNEGFSCGSVREIPLDGGRRALIVTLLLEWQPFVTIEYTMTAEYAPATGAQLDQIASNAVTSPEFSHLRRRIMPQVAVDIVVLSRYDFLRAIMNELQSKSTTSTSRRTGSSRSSSSRKHTVPPLVEGFSRFLAVIMRNDMLLYHFCNVQVPFQLSPFKSPVPQFTFTDAGHGLWSAMLLNMSIGVWRRWLDVERFDVLYQIGLTLNAIPPYRRSSSRRGFGHHSGSYSAISSLPNNATGVSSSVIHHNFKSADRNSATVALPVILSEWSSINVAKRLFVKFLPKTFDQFANWLDHNARQEERVKQTDAQAGVPADVSSDATSHQGVERSSAGQASSISPLSTTSSCAIASITWESKFLARVSLAFYDTPPTLKALVIADLKQRIAGKYFEAEPIVERTAVPSSASMSSSRPPSAGPNTPSGGVLNAPPAAHRNGNDVDSDIKVDVVQQTTQKKSRVYPFAFPLQRLSEVLLRSVSSSSSSTSSSSGSSSTSSSLAVSSAAGTPVTVGSGTSLSSTAAAAAAASSGMSSTTPRSMATLLDQKGSGDSNDSTPTGSRSSSAASTPRSSVRSRSTSVNTRQLEGSGDGMTPTGATSPHGAANMYESEFDGSIQPAGKSFSSRSQALRAFMWRRQWVWKLSSKFASYRMARSHSVAKSTPVLSSILPPSFSAGGSNSNSNSATNNSSSSGVSGLHSSSSLLHAAMSAIRRARFNEGFVLSSSDGRCYTFVRELLRKQTLDGRRVVFRPCMLQYSVSLIGTTGLQTEVWMEPGEGFVTSFESVLTDEIGSLPSMYRSRAQATEDATDLSDLLDSTFERMCSWLYSCDQHILSVLRTFDELHWAYRQAASLQVNDEDTPVVPRAASDSVPPSKAVRYCNGNTHSRLAWSRSQPLLAYLLLSLEPDHIVLNAGNIGFRTPELMYMRAGGDLSDADDPLQLQHIATDVLGRSSRSSHSARSSTARTRSSDSKHGGDIFGRKLTPAASSTHMLFGDGPSPSMRPLSSNASQVFAAKSKLRSEILHKSRLEHPDFNVTVLMEFNPNTILPLHVPRVFLPEHSTPNSAASSQLVSPAPSPLQSPRGPQTLPATLLAGSAPDALAATSYTVNLTYDLLLQSLRELCDMEIVEERVFSIHVDDRTMLLVLLPPRNDPSLTKFDQVYTDSCIFEQAAAAAAAAATVPTCMTNGCGNVTRGAAGSSVSTPGSSSTGQCGDSLTKKASDVLLHARVSDVSGSSSACPTPVRIPTGSSNSDANDTATDANSQRFPAVSQEIQSLDTLLHSLFYPIREQESMQNFASRISGTCDGEVGHQGAGKIADAIYSNSGPNSNEEAHTDDSQHVANDLDTTPQRSETDRFDDQGSSSIPPLCVSLFHCSRDTVSSPKDNPCALLLQTLQRTALQQDAHVTDGTLFHWMEQPPLLDTHDQYRDRRRSAIFASLHNRVSQTLRDRELQSGYDYDAHSIQSTNVFIEDGLIGLELNAEVASKDSTTAKAAAAATAATSTASGTASRVSELWFRSRRPSALSSLHSGDGGGINDAPPSARSTGSDSDASFVSVASSPHASSTSLLYDHHVPAHAILNSAATMLSRIHDKNYLTALYAGMCAGFMPQSSDVQLLVSSCKAFVQHIDVSLLTHLLHKFVPESSCNLDDSQHRARHHHHHHQQLLASVLKRSFDHVAGSDMFVLHQESKMVDAGTSSELRPLFARMECTFAAPPSLAMCIGHWQQLRHQIPPADLNSNQEASESGMDRDLDLDTDGVDTSMLEHVGRILDRQCFPQVCTMRQPTLIVGDHEAGQGMYQVMLPVSAGCSVAQMCHIVHALLSLAPPVSPRFVSKECADELVAVDLSAYSLPEVLPLVQFRLIWHMLDRSQAPCKSELKRKLGEMRSSSRRNTSAHRSSPSVNRGATVSGQSPVTSSVAVRTDSQTRPTAALFTPPPSSDSTHPVDSQIPPLLNLNANSSNITNAGATPAFATPSAIPAASASEDKGVSLFGKNIRVSAPESEAEWNAGPDAVGRAAFNAMLTANAPILQQAMDAAYGSLNELVSEQVLAALRHVPTELRTPRLWKLALTHMFSLDCEDSGTHSQMPPPAHAGDMHQGCGLDVTVNSAGVHGRDSVLASPVASETKRKAEYGTPILMSPTASTGASDVGSFSFNEFHPKQVPMQSFIVPLSFVPGLVDEARAVFPDKLHSTQCVSFGELKVESKTIGGATGNDPHRTFRTVNRMVKLQPLHDAVERVLHAYRPDISESVKEAFPVLYVKHIRPCISAQQASHVHNIQHTIVRPSSSPHIPEKAQSKSTHSGSSTIGGKHPNTSLGGMSEHGVPLWSACVICNDCVVVFMHDAMSSGIGPSHFINAQNSIVHAVISACIEANRAVLLDNLHRTQSCSDYLEAKIGGAAPPASKNRKSSRSSMDMDDPNDDSLVEGSMDTLGQIAKELVEEFGEEARGDVQRVLGVATEPKQSHGDRHISSSNAPSSAASSVIVTDVHEALHLTPGKFACPKVCTLLLPLHSRITLRDAMRTLAMQVLEPFAVHDRPNMFVYQEHASRSVFYLRMAGHESRSHHHYASANGVADASLETPLITDVTSIRVNQERDSTRSTRGRQSIALAVQVFGTSQPTGEITHQFYMMLRSKVDEMALSSISQVLTRNPRFKLKTSDLQFLRPRSSAPNRSVAFTLPEDIHDPFRFLLYFRQNVQHMRFLNALYVASQARDASYDTSTTAAMQGLPDINTSTTGVSSECERTHTQLWPQIAINPLDFAFYFNNYARVDLNFAAMGNGMALVHCTLVDRQGRGPVKHVGTELFVPGTQTSSLRDKKGNNSTWKALRKLAASLTANLHTIMLQIRKTAIMTELAGVPGGVAANMQVLNLRHRHKVPRGESAMRSSDYKSSSLITGSAVRGVSSQSSSLASSNSGAKLLSFDEVSLRANPRTSAWLSDDDYDDDIYDDDDLDDDADDDPDHEFSADIGDELDNNVGRHSGVRDGNSNHNDSADDGGDDAADAAAADDSDNSTLFDESVPGTTVTSGSELGVPSNGRRMIDSSVPGIKNMADVAGRLVPGPRKIHSRNHRSPGHRRPHRRRHGRASAGTQQSGDRMREMIQRQTTRLIFDVNQARQHNTRGVGLLGDATEDHVFGLEQAIWESSRVSDAAWTALVTSSSAAADAAVSTTEKPASVSQRHGSSVSDTVADPAAADEVSNRKELSLDQPSSSVVSRSGGGGWSVLTEVWAKGSIHLDAFVSRVQTCIDQSIQEYRIECLLQDQSVVKHAQRLSDNCTRESKQSDTGTLLVGMHNRILRSFERVLLDSFTLPDPTPSMHRIQLPLPLASWHVHNLLRDIARVFKAHHPNFRPWAYRVREQHPHHASQQVGESQSAYELYPLHLYHNPDVNERTDRYILLGGFAGVTPPQCLQQEFVDGSSGKLLPGSLLSDGNFSRSGSSDIVGAGDGGRADNASTSMAGKNDHGSDSVSSLALSSVSAAHRLLNDSKAMASPRRTSSAATTSNGNASRSTSRRASVESSHFNKSVLTDTTLPASTNVAPASHDSQRTHPTELAHVMYKNIELSVEAPFPWDAPGIVEPHSVEPASSLVHDADNPSDSPPASLPQDNAFIDNHPQSTTTTTISSSPSLASTVSAAAAAAVATAAEKVTVMRNCTVMAVVADRKLTVITYNWELGSIARLAAGLSRTVSWCHQRQHLLDHLLHQKMGLFNHMSPFRPPPTVFSRSHYQSSDEDGNLHSPVVNGAFGVQPPLRPALGVDGRSRNRYPTRRMTDVSRPPIKHVRTARKLNLVSNAGAGDTASSSTQLVTSDVASSIYQNTVLSSQRRYVNTGFGSSKGEIKLDAATLRRIAPPSDSSQPSSSKGTNSQGSSILKSASAASSSRVQDAPRSASLVTSVPRAHEKLKSALSKNRTSAPAQVGSSSASSSTGRIAPMRSSRASMARGPSYGGNAPKLQQQRMKALFGGRRGPLPPALQAKMAASGGSLRPRSGMASTRRPSSRAPSSRAPSSRAPSSRAPSSRAPSSHAPSSRAPSSHAPSSRVPNNSAATSTAMGSSTNSDSSRPLVSLAVGTSSPQLSSAQSAVQRNIATALHASTADMVPLVRGTSPSASHRAGTGSDSNPIQHSSTRSHSEKSDSIHSGLQHSAMPGVAGATATMHGPESQRLDLRHIQALVEHATPSLSTQARHESQRKRRRLRRRIALSHHATVYGSNGAMNHAGMTNQATQLTEPDFDLHDHLKKLLAVVSEAEQLGLDIDFSTALYGLFPSHPYHKHDSFSSSGSLVAELQHELVDPVQRYALQLVHVCATQLRRAKRRQRLFHAAQISIQCQTGTGTLTQSECTDVIDRARIVHLSRGPLLFNQYCWSQLQNSSAPTPASTPGTNVPDAVSLSQSIMYKQMTAAFVKDYTEYVATELKARPVVSPDDSLPDRMVLMKVVLGYALFIEISFKSVFACCNVYASSFGQADNRPYDSLKACKTAEERNQVHRMRQLSIDSHIIRWSSKLAVMHMQSAISSRVHMNSFIYDFHLREYARFLEDEKETYPPLNLLEALDFFEVYYPQAPKFASNLLYDRRLPANMQLDINMSDEVPPPPKSQLLAPQAVKSRCSEPPVSRPVSSSMSNIDTAHTLLLQQDFFAYVAAHAQRYRVRNLAHRKFADQMSTMPDWDLRHAHETAIFITSKNGSFAPQADIWRQTIHETEIGEEDMQSTECGSNMLDCKYMLVLFLVPDTVQNALPSTTMPHDLRSHRQLHSAMDSHLMFATGGSVSVPFPATRAASGIGLNRESSATASSTLQLPLRYFLMRVNASRCAPHETKDSMPAGQTTVTAAQTALVPADEQLTGIRSNAERLILSLLDRALVHFQRDRVWRKLTAPHPLLSNKSHRTDIDRDTHRQQPASLKTADRPILVRSAVSPTSAHRNLSPLSRGLSMATGLVTASALALPAPILPTGQSQMAVVNRSPSASMTTASASSTSFNRASVTTTASAFSSPGNHHSTSSGRAASKTPTSSSSKQRSFTARWTQRGQPSPVNPSSRSLPESQFEMKLSEEEFEIFESLSFRQNMLQLDPSLHILRQISDVMLRPASGQIHRSVSSSKSAETAYARSLPPHQAAGTGGSVNLPVDSRITDIMWGVLKKHLHSRFYPNVRHFSINQMQHLLILSPRDEDVAIHVCAQLADYAQPGTIEHYVVHREFVAMDQGEARRMVTEYANAIAYCVWRLLLIPSKRF
jgi:hypothetical protein